jgi:CcmD family protein
MTLLSRLQETVQDSTLSSGIPTPYDSVWSNPIPTQAPVGLERFMLAEDKLYVVLAVVLIIWIGLAVYLFRTDRKIRALERAVDAHAEAERSAHERISDG